MVVAQMEIKIVNSQWLKFIRFKLLIIENNLSVGLDNGTYLIDENIYQIAEQIVQLHQKAYEVYLPLVEDVCSRAISEDELSHLLDYLLDFACDEKMLGLYKRVCRRYVYVYPGCIKDYIEAYRKLWEDEVENNL